jgi:hypothetical protein
MGESEKLKLEKIKWIQVCGQWFSTLTTGMLKKTNNKLII